MPCPSRRIAHRMARRAGARPTRERGFTLVEILVVIGMIAILAGIAVPTYSDYVLRGRIVDATTALAAMQARMEQYYQDHRTYVGGPCQTAEASGTFSIRCRDTPTATEYVVNAIGSGSTNSFEYTIDQRARQRTLSLGGNWGTVASGGVACWITKKGMTC